MNKSKSSIIDINGDTVHGNVAGIPWNTFPIKILGVYFGNDERDDQNWASKITKIKNMTSLWKARRLTLFGKITIIKSFLVSQIPNDFHVSGCVEANQFNTLLILWNCLNLFSLNLFCLCNYFPCSFSNGFR